MTLLLGSTVLTIFDRGTSSVVSPVSEDKVDSPSENTASSFVSLSSMSSTHVGIFPIRLVRCLSTRSL